MTDALTRLADAVEAGMLNPVDLVILKPNEHAHAWKAYNGSLDAAKALHDAMLPNCAWDIWRVPVFDNDPRKYGCNIAAVDTAYAETPARAWLMAIIRALAQANPLPEAVQVLEHPSATKVRRAAQMRGEIIDSVLHAVTDALDDLRKGIAHGEDDE